MVVLAVNPRVWVVLGLLFLFALARRLWRHWQDERRRRVTPRPGAVLPGELVGGASRTWAVFTTPWCASCGPVVGRLRSLEPASRVLVIDATEESALAQHLGIRAAPTALLADADGRVVLQLTGADAVHHHLDGLASSSVGPAGAPLPRRTAG